MKIHTRDRLTRRVRAELRREAVKRRIAPRRAATYMLGAALGMGGATDMVDRLDLMPFLDGKTAAAEAVEVVRDEVAAREDVVVEPASEPIIQIHSLINSAWLPEIATDPLEGEKVSLISAQTRESFFETKIPYGRIIHEKAIKYDVDPLLVAAVVQAESSFRPRAVSPAGARGLMQLMPRTGRWMGARNLTDPEQNVDAGVKYLKYLERRFNGNRELQIAAYNGGEGNVRRYRGVPPFRETRSYVSRVMKNYDRQKSRMESYERSMQAQVATR